MPTEEYVAPSEPGFKQVSLADFAFVGDGFLTGDDEPQEWLIDGLFPHPSAGMLWGWRGLGKTHSAISLAVAVASAGRWLGADRMRAPKERVVLYLDFEMSRRALRKRFRAATGGTMPGGLIVVPVEEYAKHARSKPNLATEAGRQAIVDLLKAVEQREGLRIDLLILDNWVSSVRGIDENNNAELGEVVNWFTGLRAAGCSVLYLHHASKSGVQRGASGREDLLDYVVALEPPKNWIPYGQAHFIVDLEKTREQPDPTVWAEAIEVKLIAGEFRVAFASDQEAEASKAWARGVETKILQGLADGVSPANAVPKLNGKLRAGVLVKMNERGWIVRKDPAKDQSPWQITTAGRAELTKRDRASAGGAEIVEFPAA